MTVILMPVTILEDTFLLNPDPDFFFLLVNINLDPDTSFE